MASINDILQMLELGSIKGVITSLVLPPVPLILLMPFGAWMLRRKRLLLGWSLVLGSSLALWLSSTTLVGWALMQVMLRPPPALSAGAIADLKLLAAEQKTAIVVLGAGRERFAPEYGVSNLTAWSVERLRYGIWLSRATGLPLAFSGGVAHNSEDGATEAEIAARIATSEFNRPLRWTETRSRDTSENALYTVALLHDAGMQRIVLVTHGFHMRRASAAFARAVQHAAAPITVVPAPMGMATKSGGWLPSHEGFVQTRLALREWLGWVAGA